MAFYVVGELFNMYCVYDSDDQSCEFVDKLNLNKFGVVVSFEKLPVISVYKLKALYCGLKDSVHVLKSCYSAVDVNDKILETAIIEFNLDVCDKPDQKDLNWLHKMHDEYGYDVNYVSRIFFRSNKPLRWFGSDNFVKSGYYAYNFIVPSLMMSYLLRLTLGTGSNKCDDFKKFIGAFNGLLSDKLMFKTLYTKKFLINRWVHTEYYFYNHG